MIIAQILAEYNIDLENIYNMDENEFNIDII